jgi:hypothetical protein
MGPFSQQDVPSMICKLLSGADCDVTSPCRRVWSLDIADNKEADHGDGSPPDLLWRRKP